MSISVVFICCSLATSYALPTTDNLLTIKDPTLFESETHSHIQLEHVGHAHALHTQTVRSCAEQVAGYAVLISVQLISKRRGCETTKDQKFQPQSLDTFSPGPMDTCLGVKTLQHFLEQCSNDTYT